MSAPEHQPNDPGQPTGGVGAGSGTGSPGPVVSGPQGAAPGPQQPAQAGAQPVRPRPSQPQYGQYAQPDYGAMRSQFGPNYDPYLYGAPDPDPKTEDAGQDGNGGQGQGAAPQTNRQYPAYPTNQANQPYPASQPGQAGWPGPGAGGNGAGDARRPHLINGIDVDDPNQNPLYGRWDLYAIIAFVFALIFAIPLLPALMGASSIWRTRTFHMKGQGFAIAAVVINLLTTIVLVWAWANGIDLNALADQMLGMYGMGGGSSGSSGDSMSA